MKLLTRYVLRHFLSFFAMALFGFGGIYMVVDFFEKFDDVLERHASMADAALYFLLKLPLILNQGIPMAVLLATLIGLGILERNRELVAMRSAGIGVRTYAAPILGAALVISGLTFVLGETLARDFNRRAQEVWDHRIEGRDRSLGWLSENIWYRGEEVIYRIRLYDVRSQKLHGVSLYFLDDAFNLKECLEAEELRWEGSEWTAHKGALLRYGPEEIEQEVFGVRKLELAETPADFTRLDALPQELDWFELYRYTRKLVEDGYDAAPYRVELHTRVAFPLMSVILAVMGIAISLRTGRYGGIAMGIVLALVAAFVYIMVLQLGSSLATAGILPPTVGVWAGNVLFTALGWHLWVKARQ